MRRSFVPAALGAVCALSACAGNGEGLDENGRPLTGTEQPLVPELRSIQEHVFTPVCTGCHSGAAAPLGFRLDAESAYAMLVNAPSVEASGLLRVDPGDPSSSYLIQKLEGRAAVGAQMPLGQPPLPQATIDVIRQWITDGAQSAASAQPTKSTEPMRIRAIAPAPEEALAKPPAEIVLAAAGPLDLSTVDSASVTLERSGADGRFDDGNEVAMSDMRMSFRSLDPTVIAISLPDAVWVNDRYRLRIAGRGAAPARGVDGMPVADFALEFTIGDAP